VLTERDIARGALRDYKIVVVPPPIGEARGVVVELAHGQVIRSLAGITPGLGS
jgi:hypothetical protein